MTTETAQWREGHYGMQGVFSVKLPLVLVLVLVLMGTEANKRGKSHRADVKHEKLRAGSECPPAETQYSRCVAESGDCGDGLRDVTCKDHTHKIHCRIPCNWKKDISDCKYKFGPWGNCDAATNTKSRSGTLKKALFNAQCQNSVRVSKPCSPRTKKTRGEKKTN
ncbi:hypothetical protein INR49_007554 [Caranx melampygus]|nr:hypothetical protein INR49_007554 [Caranx melampygus]